MDEIDPTMVKMNTDGITFGAIGWGEISHEISRSL